MAQKYALLGGGGFAIELYGYMTSDGYDVAGYYAPEVDETTSSFMQYLGDERDSFSREYKYVIASGFVNIRKKIISFIEQNDLDVGNYISSLAFVSPLARYGLGIIAVPFSILTGNPTVGSYALLNCHACISHHCQTGDNIVLSPYAILCGHSNAGSNVTLGTSVTVIPDVSICDDVEIGAGATVIRNISEPGTYVGSPARKL